MSNKTSDTIAMLSCGLAMLSTLGLLPSDGSGHPAPIRLQAIAMAHAQAPDAPPAPVRVSGPEWPTVAPTPRSVPTAPMVRPVPSAVAVVPNPGVLLHAPSVSVAVIGRELAAAGAPFAAEVWDHKSVARYIYDAARWWGLDPAMVLAFAHHESGYGTVGMATQTHGPCNIRPLDGVGYRQYASWQAGMDDCIRLLGKYGRDYGHNELANAVATWAPSSENSVPDYVTDVVQTVSRLHQESN